MPLLLDQTDSSSPFPLPRSSSAHTGSRAPFGVGTTGSILSLVDRERHILSAASPCPPEQQLWTQSGRSSSTGRLLRYGKQTVPSRLETVAESKVKVPKWKQFLRKFRKGSEKGDGSKATGSAISVEVKQQYGGESLKDKPTKDGVSRDRRVSIISSVPTPLPKPREMPSSLLWERRNAAQISPLDLRKVRHRKSAKGL